MNVSRETSAPDAFVSKCSRCDNPPRPGQRLCVACHTKNMRVWRAGRRNMVVSPFERAVILAIRAMLKQRG